MQGVPIGASAIRFVVAIIARHDLWPEVNRTELSLQLNGGYSLDPGTVSMRLDEFMQYYSKKPDAFTKFLLPPARTRGAPNTNTPKDIMLELHLQVYIHDDLVCHLQVSCRCKLLLFPV